jgi:threonine efflux protein
MQSDFLSPALAVALTAYTLGVASPGPSNMAIMATAMSLGRGRALMLALGIVCGSLTWGFTAAFGLAALMRSYSQVLLVLKLLGGLYLLFLAWKAAKSALSNKPLDLPRQPAKHSQWGTFASGLAIHLLNPKAIFVWLSIVALALPPEATRSQALGVVAACGTIGAIVFFGYALVFSMQVARNFYFRIHRWFNGLLSGVFAFSGLRLLLSRTEF